MRFGAFSSITRAYTSRCLGARVRRRCGCGRGGAFLFSVLMAVASAFFWYVRHRLTVRLKKQ